VSSDQLVNSCEQYLKAYDERETYSRLIKVGTWVVGATVIADIGVEAYREFEGKGFDLRAPIATAVSVGALVAVRMLRRRSNNRVQEYSEEILAPSD